MNEEYCGFPAGNCLFREKIALLEATAEAADWLDHLNNGVGKDGHTASTNEWSAAYEAVHRALAALREAGLL